MVKTSNFKQIEVGSALQLRKWLTKHHSQKESVWLVTFKKHVVNKYVSVQDVLDELLCFGWIDGIRRKLDEDRTMLLISPRKTQHWAKPYKDRFKKLEKEGLVTDAGKRAVVESKKKGLWDFMNDVDALIKPPDFVKALNEHNGAMKNFDSFGDSAKRFTLRWIKLAKTPATRAKRIKEAASLAAKSEKIPGI
jgi:uncharacterized protein YdeI (YjbR/CyaY-like superfamily)